MLTCRMTRKLLLLSWINRYYLDTMPVWDSNNARSIA